MQKEQQKSKFKRIILKIGGELFGKTENGWGISFSAYEHVAKDIIQIKKEIDVQLSIVVGAGNIFRGREVNGSEADEAVADSMGMLGTVINGLALQEALERFGCPTRMMTAVHMQGVAEPFIRRRAIRHLEKERIVIFTGGTGNPFFTTDSAAALRACEINCDLILKATGANGIYDKDPRKFKEAKMYKNISYKEALKKKLSVMDATAFALCWDKKKPIVVFNVKDIILIPEILRGKRIGTLVS